MRALLLASSAAFAIALAAPRAAAAGEGADAATARGTARKLGQEAVKLYEAGDYGAALEKFNTADSLVPTPTLGLFAARCLVKLNRVVEASERYLEVTRMQLDRGALPLMRKAQADAVAERDKLLPQIPTLEVRLDGPAGAGVSVFVDDKPLLAGLLGERRPMDPGSHKVDAKRVDTSVSQQVTLVLGKASQVVLQLPELPPAPTAAMHPARKVAWIAIGVGGAGAIVAGVSGAIAIAKGQSLLQACPGHTCSGSQMTPENRSAASSYDAARWASLAGFVTAGVGLAVGVPLVAAGPKVRYVYPDGSPAPAPAEATPSAWIAPFVTWNGGGLSGAF